MVSALLNRNNFNTEGGLHQPYLTLSRD